MRIASVRKLQEAWGLDIEYHDVYGLKEFLRAVVNREEDRCAFCYAMRLKETARTAKRLGLDGFTTSLLVSPYQKFDMIVRTGREMEAEFSIPFYYEDFRSGWKNSISLSRELGLYRQNYCGCVYSEMERHIGKNSQTGYKTNDR
jgi:predicted adenine nucleotide alpha hydrolase (AANH) superfamily ATPase